mmetsp:Transcript_85410/g.245270  ORF Transcript_85410/g.245270 Transcript_85410/m.245270 type:complete len:222 (+) Transcript_85410:1284-1949(+)
MSHSSARPRSRSLRSRTRPRRRRSCRPTRTRRTMRSRRTSAGNAWRRPSAASCRLPRSISRPRSCPSARRDCRLGSAASSTGSWLSSLAATSSCTSRSCRSRFGRCSSPRFCRALAMRTRTCGRPAPTPSASPRRCRVSHKLRPMPSGNSGRCSAARCRRSATTRARSRWTTVSPRCSCWRATSTRHAHRTCLLGSSWSTSCQSATTRTRRKRCTKPWWNS